MIKSAFMLALVLAFIAPFYWFFCYNNNFTAPPYWTFFDKLEYQYYTKMDEFNLFDSQQNPQYALMYKEQNAFINNRFGYYDCVQKNSSDTEKCKPFEDRFKIMYRTYYMLAE